MKLYNYASGSKGNCQSVRLKGSKAPFICECGISAKQLAKASAQCKGPELAGHRCAFVTHSHNDHAEFIGDYMERGLDVYCSEETAMKCGGTALPPMSWTYVESVGVAVLPFPVEHDAEGSVGYVFRTKEECLVYWNDCKRILADLSGIKPDAVVAECDYLMTYLEAMELQAKNVVRRGSGASTEASATLIRLARQKAFHSSIHDTLASIRGLDLSNCKGIFISHLSERLADGPAMCEELTKNLGIQVHYFQRKGGIA